MNFRGRWVPMEVMDTIFLQWGISALIAIAIIFYLRRRHRAGKSKQVPQRKARAAKRKKSRQ